MSSKIGFLPSLNWMYFFLYDVKMNRVFHFQSVFFVVTIVFTSKLNHNNKKKFKYGWAILTKNHWYFQAEWQYKIYVYLTFFYEVGQSPFEMSTALLLKQTNKQTDIKIKYLFENIQLQNM